MESIQLFHRPQLYSDPIRKDADMNSLEELWSHILATMFEKKPFSEASFNLWLKDMQLIELTKTSVYLGVPNEFKLRFISQKYMEFIREILTELVGAVKQIVLISQESAIPDVAGAIEEFLQTGEDRPYLFCYRCREGREESAPAEPEPEESDPLSEAITKGVDAAGVLILKPFKKKLKAKKRSSGKKKKDDKSDQ